MKYERFVELGRNRWLELERNLDRLEHRSRDLGHGDLEALAVDYRQLLHDHALASSRFPSTWAAAFLGRLAVRANHLLQWQPPRKKLSLIGFYRDTLPRLCREIETELVVCAALLLLSAALGLLMTVADPAIGTGFVGTEAAQGLGRGEIWTDRVGEASPMFSSLIATNNMRVALNAWLGGLAAGVWSLVIVGFNGLMLGSVIALTMHYGMAGELLEFIAAHGPLELSLIVVAAAAGVHVGWSLISFGDRPRGERLKESSLRSIQILLACLPFFVVLGIVESFVSPSPAVPALTKVVVGLGLELGFVALLLGAASNHRTETQA